MVSAMPKKFYVQRKYNVVYFDTPWFGYTPCGTAKLPYKTLTKEQVYDLDLKKYMAKRCVIFAWVTCPFIVQQNLAIDHWCRKFNLRPLGVPYIWIKTKKDGTPIGAAGPRPSLVKPLGEFVIAMTNVRHGRPLPLLTEAQSQWVFAPKPPRGAHSRKPAEVANRIVELFGDVPRVELFGREHRDGWDVIGDQSPHIRMKIT